MARRVAKPELPGQLRTPASQCIGSATSNSAPEGRAPVLACAPPATAVWELQERNCVFSFTHDPTSIFFLVQLGGGTSSDSPSTSWPAWRGAAVTREEGQPPGRFCRYPFHFRASYSRSASRDDARPIALLQQLSMSGISMVLRGRETTWLAATPHHAADPAIPDRDDEWDGVAGNGWCPSQSSTANSDPIVSETYWGPLVLVGWEQWGLSRNLRCRRGAALKRHYCSIESAEWLGSLILRIGGADPLHVASGHVLQGWLRSPLHTSPFVVFVFRT